MPRVERERERKKDNNKKKSRHPRGPVPEMIRNAMRYVCVGGFESALCVNTEIFLTDEEMKR